MAVTLLLLPNSSNLISSLANLIMFQALIPFTVKIKFVEVAVKFACNLSSEKAQVPFAMPTKFEYRAVSLNEPSVPITSVSVYPGTITFAPFNVFALKTHSPARRDFLNVGFSNACGGDCIGSGSRR